MATKYIRHGETYNGDGTSSAAATSNGGVGAWNNINVFEGTAPAYGTAPAAGDVVYIRSKDNAGANITRTMAGAVSLGKSGLSSAQAVSWVVDGGSVWAGINGVVTYRRTDGHTITILAYNTIEAEAEDAWVIADEYVSAAAQVMLQVNSGVVLRNLFCDFDNVTFNNGGPSSIVLAGSTSGGCTLINPRISLPNQWYYYVIAASDYSLAEIVNPRMTMGTNWTSYPIFSVGSYGSALRITGGSLTGAGATTGVKLLQLSGTAPGTAHLSGFSFPRAMTAAVLPTANGTEACAQMMGIDGGGMGAYRMGRWGEMDSRSDGYYPTLNATYPDTGNSPWSWRVYPSNASRAHPCELGFFKVFTATAAAKTITAELLVADTIITANKGSLWFEVSYVDDATAAVKFVTSANLASSAALDTSSAAWTAATWGAINLLKRKIAVTTPTSIKQNTMISMRLCATFKSASALDIFFVDPDPQLT
jgi:hypothetical protein